VISASGLEMKKALKFAKEKGIGKILSLGKTLYGFKSPLQCPIVSSGNFTNQSIIDKTYLMIQRSRNFL
jgi:hypothetical protein